MNLLEETLKAIAGREVIQVQSRNCVCSWETFAEMAKDFEYDEGHTRQEVNPSLGNGWWIERDEYDGSQHITFEILPLSGSLELKNGY